MERYGTASPPPERALARALALGVVQRLNTLDWALAPLVSRSFASLDPPVRAALRLGAWQLLFAADRFPAYAAVNETVPLAGSRAKALVNGVLRALQRQGGLKPFPVDAVERLSLQYSYPAWLVKRWTEKALQAGNDAPPLFLRANRLKTTPEALVERLKKEGHEAAPTGLSPDGVRVDAFSLMESWSFQEGLFSVQDEAAQVAVHLLDPRPGETILDLCAGVGGKSCHMAERMGNRGRVLAVDSAADRLQTLKENARRLGVSIVEPVIEDARDPAGARADRVFVDAPCSGLGTIRRRPDIKWARSEKDVTERLPVLQKEILRAAAGRVKPGGVLVYATCTTEPEENEEVVRTLGDFDLEKTENLRPEVHGTDGFFIAKLRRR